MLPTFKSCQIKFSAMWVKVLVVLKTRTFILATKLRQKFNRFSPFRDLTSFVTSFTAPWYMLSIQTSAFQNWQICGFCKITQKKKYSGEKTFGLWKTQESDNTDENWCLGCSGIVSGLWNNFTWIHLSSQLWKYSYGCTTLSLKKNTFQSKVEKTRKRNKCLQISVVLFSPHYLQKSQLHNVHLKYLH